MAGAQDIPIAVVVLFALIMAVGAGRSLSPHVSTTVFSGNEQYRRPPLAVLRADAPGGGAPPPSELEVFSEDPDWAYKVRCAGTVVHQYVPSGGFRGWPIAGPENLVHGTDPLLDTVVRFYDDGKYAHQLFLASEPPPPPPPPPGIGQQVGSVEGVNLSDGST